jgi:hypothetical protein
VCVWLSTAVALPKDNSCSSCVLLQLVDSSLTAFATVAAFTTAAYRYHRCIDCKHRQSASPTPWLHAYRCPSEAVSPNHVCLSTSQTHLSHSDIHKHPLAKDANTIDAGHHQASLSLHFRTLTHLNPYTLWLEATFCRLRLSP